MEAINHARGEAQRCAGRVACAPLALLLVSGCAFNVTRYTDGPLTAYLSQPLPRIERPLAQTLSLEMIEFQTAGGFKGVLISDLVAREIYLLPEEVGLEAKRRLDLDAEFDAGATYQTLNYLARSRQQARHMQTGAAVPAMSTATATSNYTRAYVDRQSAFAREAYAGGDYLKGDIHNSAAINAMQIDQAFAGAQASVDLAFAALGGLAAAGRALYQSEYNGMRAWLETQSGAIGPAAPQGRHLSVYLLQFFDAEAFQLDSRNRVAVLLVLTDENGESKTVLEGSDILNCEDQCNLFQPKPTAAVLPATGNSEDIQRLLFTEPGNRQMLDNGFDALSGFYWYILLHHGLQKLAG